MAALLRNTFSSCADMRPNIDGFIYIPKAKLSLHSTRSSFKKMEVLANSTLHTLSPTCSRTTGGLLQRRRRKRGRAARRSVTFFCFASSFSLWLTLSEHRLPCSIRSWVHPPVAVAAAATKALKTTLPARPLPSLQTRLPTQVPTKGLQMIPTPKHHPQNVELKKKEEPTKNCEDI